jgi:hypothetical protein
VPIVSKDGKAVPFAQDNIPYKPKHWLRFQRKAPDRELVFRRYPGRTQRHQTGLRLKKPPNGLTESDPTCRRTACRHDKLYSR